MPGYCTVPFCKSKKGSSPGVSFHELPSDLARRNKWLKAISKQGKDKGSEFIPNAWTVVCSQHFLPCDFRDDIKIRKLKNDASPSIFHDYPSYMVKPIPHLRRELKRVALPLPPPMGMPLKRHCQGNESVETILCIENSQLGECTTQPNANESVLCTKVDQSVQADILSMDSISSLRIQVSNLNKKLGRRNLALLDARKQLDSLKDQLNDISKDNHNAALRDVIKEAEENDDSSAHFLLEQLLNFGKASPRYLEATLRTCIAWRAKSTSGYEHVRTNNILKIPSRTTLQRYMGTSDAEVGVTTLVKQRLLLEIQNLKPEETFGSIIIDEMSLNEKLIYDKAKDRFFGNVAMQTENKENNDHRLANHLLCFLLEGLSTRYTIPVAYFFTRCLAAKELFQMTKCVLTCVEDCGFRVVRIVTDNHRTNTSMFKKFGNGELKFQIPHPIDNSRLLFLSFDPNHIMKNLWSQFLSREIAGEKNVISSKYLKKLFEIQKNMLVKPARFLKQIHIAPSNFQKMRVYPAVQVFSPPVTAAIEALRDNSLCHPQAVFFRYSTDTVVLMKTYYKWFKLHNVSNRTYFISATEENSRHFLNVNDERLHWLEHDFINYLLDIKLRSEEIFDTCFLTDETFEAICHTSRATPNCVKYLLQQGFAFVFTRAFSSDPIESLYGELRQMCGGNDIVDVRAATFAIESILKSGIVKSATGGRKLPQVDCLMERDDGHKNLPPEVINVLHRLSNPVETECYPTATVKTFSLTMVAGYLVRVVEEKISCLDCKEMLFTTRSTGPLFSFLRNQDRGGLFYPKQEFVSVLCILQTFCEQAVPLMNLNKPGILTYLKSIALSIMENCSFFQCPKFEEKHNYLLCSLIFEKFIRPLLRNYTDLKNARIRKCMIQNKPQSRKVLRV